MQSPRRTFATTAASPRWVARLICRSKRRLIDGARLPLTIAISFAVAGGFPNCAIAAPAPTQTSADTELPSHVPPIKPPVSAALPAQEMLLTPTIRARPYNGQKIDVLTYHYDNGRTGWDKSEETLTPASVSSPHFGLLKTLQVDGNVFAQPLLVSAFRLPDGTIHDVLIVVTGHNSVYAYDVNNNYKLLWGPESLGTPQSNTDVGCMDVRPEYGITSTPVIVRKAAGSATLYVVAAVEPTHLEFHTYLHALDLATGRDRYPPVEISPRATLANGSVTTFNPKAQWSRAGLAYNKGSIYVSIGSHCDNEAYSITGWELRYSEDLTLQATFHTITTPQVFGLASVWMTGFAPGVDESGDVYIVTGNGDFAPAPVNDFGESVLRLDGASLAVKDSFTPANFGLLNLQDMDFGSGGIVLLPDLGDASAPKMAVAIGKDPTLYLLNRANLGKARLGDSGALQSLRIGQGLGVYGGPAFYVGPDGPTIFVQIQQDVVRSYGLQISKQPGGAVSVPVLVERNQGTTKAGYGGSIPIISSAGASPGTALLWFMSRTNPIELQAYNAEKLGSPICILNVGNWSNPGYGNSFLTPMVANGRVYAAAFGVVNVFGLIEGTQPGSGCNIAATKP